MLSWFIFYVCLVQIFIQSINCQNVCTCSQLDRCVKEKVDQKTQQLATCRQSCQSQISKGAEVGECYALRDNQADASKQELKQCMDQSGFKPCLNGRRKRQSQFGVFGEIVQSLFTGSGVDWEKMLGGNGLWGLGSGVDGQFVPDAGDSGGTDGTSGQFGGNNWGSSGGGGGGGGWTPNGGDGGGNQGGNSWNQGGGNGNNGGSSWNQGGNGNRGGWSSGGGDGQRGSSSAVERYRRIGLDIKGTGQTEIEKYEQCVKDCTKGGRPQSNFGRGRGKRQGFRFGDGASNGGSSGSSGRRSHGPYGECSASLGCQLNTQTGNTGASKPSCSSKSGMKEMMQSFCQCLQYIYGTSDVNCNSIGSRNGSPNSNGGSNGGNSNSANNPTWSRRGGGFNTGNSNSNGNFANPGVSGVGSSNIGSVPNQGNSFIQQLLQLAGGGRR